MRRSERWSIELGGATDVLTASAAGLLLPLAHLGHWYFYPLYALPVVIVLWSAISTARRERRAAKPQDDRVGGGRRR
jgi:hypothetical protein